MNANAINTSPPDAAIDPLARHSEITTGIRIDALRNCSVSELFHLRDALHTINDVICGLMWSPHLQDDAGGKVLSGLSEFACWYEDAIVASAKAARPTSKNDVNWRSWTILGHEVACAEDLARVSAMAAQAVCDEDDAEFDERHQS